jgi:hypothetical protein
LFCPASRKPLEPTQSPTKCVPLAPVPGREIGRDVKLPTNIRCEVKATFSIMRGDTAVLL